MRGQHLKPMSIKIEPQLHAILPELSRLNSHRTIGEITRRLLWQEAERLGLGKRTDAVHVARRHRYTT